MLLPHAQAYDSMKPHAVELDLEKYCDIYEISRMDKQEVEDLLESKVLSADDAETLKALKLVSQKMQLARKLFLCGLLALDADGGKSDFTRWTVAIDMMRILSTISADATIRLESILSEEERSIAPPSPNLVTSPGKERVKTQVRKLASLSQGIRCLQAKMHVLREESDRALDEPDQVSELGTSLMAQYDSIGADLKSLTQEWEDGRIALANNIDKNERRLSLSPAALLSPRSPAMSLSGLTAVGGSPTDALKVLNGDYESSRSADATSSDEEVFEAIALPRQRSSLTREERIAKMKEDRIRQAVVREKADANTHMLRELETVIKLRPRGRTTGRNTSV
ncbi:hypothetical protein MMC20_006143 [Loxospora ochrophaea]|nr:hypothetical protein [Loxospora ochrophaea]